MVNLGKVAMAYFYKWLSCLGLLQLDQVEACVNYHEFSDAIRRGFTPTVLEIAHSSLPSVVWCLLLLCVSVQLYLDDLTSLKSVHWLVCELKTVSYSFDLYGDLLDGVCL